MKVPNFWSISKCFLITVEARTDAVLFSKATRSDTPSLMAV